MVQISRKLKAVFAIIAVLNLLFGVVYLGTAGLKGFNGTGGEDTLLFQLVAYVSIGIIFTGIIALSQVFRPGRGISLLLAILLILTGIPSFLFTLFITGILNIALGIVVLFMRRGMRTKKIETTPSDNSPSPDKSSSENPTDKKS